MQLHWSNGQKIKPPAHPVSKNPQNQNRGIPLQGVQSITNDNHKEGETSSLMKRGKEIEG